jgi:4-hydroxy-2-oxoheptanedioate aldolase
MEFDPPVSFGIGWLPHSVIKDEEYLQTEDAWRCSMTRITSNSLKKKLQNGQNVFGTCITTSAPLWPGIVSDCGLDFVIAPYLETVAQLKELVGATKYRPLKGERLARCLDGTEAIGENLQSYWNKYNDGILCIASIESVPALENLDNLLRIDGIDAVFIGPHDLSLNMGIPEQYDHPDFIEAVKTIIKKARQYTLGVGIHFALEPERQIQWIKEGVNVVVHSSDMALFSQRLTEDLQIIRAASGDESPDYLSDQIPQV